MPHAAIDRLRRVSSPQNAVVKQLRRAFARSEPTDEGFCAIESVRIVEEAIRSGVKFKAVFFSESALPRAHRLLPQIGSHTETLLLPDDVFSSAVATESPQGVAALVELRTTSFEALLAAATAPQAPTPLLVCVAGLQDPGNLGTILRSAEAFGAAGVLLGEGTVSPYNSKAVRASAGSLFRLKTASARLENVLPALRSGGCRLIATSSHKGMPLAEAKLSDALAFFIGNEGAGLDRNLMAEMDETVVIPHAARVESLNAGVAASIVLYEIERQRNLKFSAQQSSGERNTKDQKRN